MDKARQLRSPLGGKCLGIDELGNIMLLGGSEGKYWSPISCPKVRVEKGRIVFELKGWEKEAEGISQVKGWENLRCLGDKFIGSSDRYSKSDNYCRRG